MRVLVGMWQAIWTAAVVGGKWFRGLTHKRQAALVLALSLAAVGPLGLGDQTGDREIRTHSRPPEAVGVSQPAEPRELPQGISGDGAGRPRETGGLQVASVTDGDTLRLADGRSVRLAQVDAPETGECFGGPSTAALDGLVRGRTVDLRRSATGPELDRYGRTLADIVVAGLSVNEQLIRDGAAEWYEQFASEDSELADRLANAEAEAKAMGRGLWSACKRPSAATGGTPPPPRQSAATMPATSPPQNSGGCHSSYAGTCIPPDTSDADCAGGGGNGPWYVQEKNIQVVGPDVFALDRDRDGIGCEA